jgi:hypothetical protein
MARRTKLTPEVQDTIVKTLAVGNFFETVCQAAGIDPRTGFEWLQRGRGEHPHRGQAPLYAQFAQAVSRAQARDEVDTIARIKQAGRGGALLSIRIEHRANGATVTTKTYTAPDWRTDAWYLERKYPQRWAPQVWIVVEGALQSYAVLVADKYGLDVRALLRDVEAAILGVQRGIA